ncbi:MAG: hypothetical protein PUE73_07340 [Eubacteriales bacterium]|nr:hypothetical protein [Eubacteriales bacterium]
MILHTIVNPVDVYYPLGDCSTGNSVRSSNPYDYIRGGYYLDNATLFGGSNNVNLNCNFSGNIPSNHLGIPLE